MQVAECSLDQELGHLLGVSSYTGHATMAAVKEATLQSPVLGVAPTPLHTLGHKLKMTYLVGTTLAHRLYSAAQKTVTI